MAIETIITFGVYLIFLMGLALDSLYTVRMTVAKAYKHVANKGRMNTRMLKSTWLAKPCSHF